RSRPVPDAKVQISPNWHRWVAGFSMMSSEIREQRDVFEAAVERFYDNAQDRVHVMSGDLKDSGEVWTEIEGGEFRGHVGFGGGDVDYAIHEHRRGGNHALLKNGWLATEREFGDVLPEMWKRVLRSWN